MDSLPPIDDVLTKIHELDAPAMDGTRASDQWFEAMPELKVLLQHLAKNYDCDYTQISRTSSLRRTAAPRGCG